METVVKLSKTMLIPSMFLITITLVVKCLKYEYEQYQVSSVINTLQGVG